jgi:ABC-type branched-subunit amino acid transport system ATPase component
MSDIALHVRGLTCRFEARAVVDDVGFSINRGEIVGLIGPNGSGKTTTLNAISGLLGGYQGRTELDGVAIDQLCAAQRSRLGLGRSFQLDRGYWQLTMTERAFVQCVPDGRERLVSALVDMARAHTMRWWSAARELVKEGTVEDGDRRLDQVSPGQLKWFSLALLFKSGRRTLLLDEPFTGLSPASGNLVAEQIRRFSSDGGTALIVDHDLDQMRRCCCRLLLLDGGRLIASGPTAAVLSDAAVLSTYLGKAHGPATDV